MRTLGTKNTPTVYWGKSAISTNSISRTVVSEARPMSTARVLLITCSNQRHEVTES